MNNIEALKLSFRGLSDEEEETGVDVGGGEETLDEDEEEGDGYEEA